MKSIHDPVRLDEVFHPQSVAVIGASSGFGKWGQMIISNIVAGEYGGDIYPVNPKEERICGLPVYRDIRVGIVTLGGGWGVVKSTRQVDPSVTEDFLEQIDDLVRTYEQYYIASLVDMMETYGKPVIGVSLSNTDEGTVRPVDGKRYSGVFYQTPENAVNVLARMVAYQDFLQGGG